MTIGRNGPATRERRRPGRVEIALPDAGHATTNRPARPSARAATSHACAGGLARPDRAHDRGPDCPDGGREPFAAARADARAIALHWWGEPNGALCRRNEWRWGRRGSRALALTGSRVGLWHDHGTGEGGDAADLVARELGGMGAALDWIAERFGLDRGAARNRPTSCAVPPGATGRHAATRPPARPAPPLDVAKRERALALWRGAAPIAGTPAEAYLVARLGGHRVPPDALASGALRFLCHPGLYGHERAPEGAASTMLAAIAHPLTGAFVGMHRTFLDAYGQRFDKRMLGRGYGVCRLHDPDRTADPLPGLAIAEGIETALAAWVRSGLPAWAALDAGRLARFPGDGEQAVPPWAMPDTEALTVFADHDATRPDGTGGAGQRAAAALVRRWRAGGARGGGLRLADRGGGRRGRAGARRRAGRRTRQGGGPMSAATNGAGPVTPERDPALTPLAVPPAPSPHGTNGNGTNGSDRRNGREAFDRGEKVPYVPRERGRLIDLSVPRPVQPEPALVRGVIPRRGVGFLAGQSGSFKTFMAIEIAFAVMRGESFAGRPVDEGGGVLLVAAEGEGSLDARLAARRSLLPDPAERLPLIALTGFGSIKGDEAHADLALTVRRAEHDLAAMGHRLALVIVDTVTAAGMLGRDGENDPGAWTEAVAPMQAIAAAHGCAPSCWCITSARTPTRGCLDRPPRGGPPTSASPSPVGARAGSAPRAIITSTCSSTATRPRGRWGRYGTNWSRLASTRTASPSPRSCWRSTRPRTRPSPSAGAAPPSSPSSVRSPRPATRTARPSARVATPTDRRCARCGCPSCARPSVEPTRRGGR